MDNLNFANLSILEEMYEKYRTSPTLVGQEWAHFFKEFEESTALPMSSSSLEVREKGDEELAVFQLIQAHRQYGHLLAAINPIAVQKPEVPAELKPETYGLSSEAFERDYLTWGVLPTERASLRKIIKALQSIYSGTIGFEYAGLQQPELEHWLQERIEAAQFKKTVTIEQKKLILQQLNKSELLEIFLHTKYVGQKRFSLEGGETLIPLLAILIEGGAELGVEEAVIGMAHRGRLNVLCNILQKSYAEVFSEFEDSYIPNSIEGTGDVKYHKGFSSEIMTKHGQKVQISLTPNPSHLEAVDPVVQGQVRAKQVGKKDLFIGKKVLPILIHGDAALAGQGVIYETLQLYKLVGYSTGGTIHIAINNQIGFTTLARDGRSTRYCADIARAFGAPVFHVNAEDPEGCVLATLLALEVRQKFHCDVFIDMNCYRKYGHNETDEPAFTQPLEYQLIRKKKPIREIYRDDLIQQGIVERHIAQALEEEFKNALNKELKELKEGKSIPKKAQKEKKNSEVEIENPFEPVMTAVPLKILQEAATSFCSIPKDFNIHPKLAHLLKERLSMVEQSSSKKVDWGMGEMLAYASLLLEGFPIRLSGQDVGRGTFSHRHATWMDQVKEETYTSLAYLKNGKALFEVYNSPLSEFAVLGFEFGYSLCADHSLVLWEAQFGDFCNGAQVIIDQFIATSEQKWGQKSSLVLLLPHGYEGQGPEHSSARMERFLTLCGHNNMQIVNPSTPAQLFHLLRRQMLQKMRKPLVIFTPKGLLRHPDCVSPIDDLAKGSFQELLEDPTPALKTKRFVLCNGRIYYDLIAERERTKTNDVTIVRVEQLYPLHLNKLKTLIERYQEIKECFWVQEEPSNMGAWNFIQPLLYEILPKNVTLKYVGRARSASPAVGSHSVHKQEFKGLMRALFPE